MALASLAWTPVWADGGAGGASFNGPLGGTGGSYGNPTGGPGSSGFFGGGGGGGGVSLMTGAGGNGGTSGGGLPGGNGGTVGNPGSAGYIGTRSGGSGGGGGGFGSFLNNTGAADNPLGTTLTGGAGGAGGNDFSDGGGGGGGTGGGGLLLLGSGVYTNAGTLAGGVGGAGGSSFGFLSNGGGGGDGGVGAAVMGGRLINSGTITGGTGGLGGTGGVNGAAGAGGVGVIGSGFSLVNSDTITGGLSGGPSPVQADAIQFTGGTNSLELQSGSTITGNVDATVGTNTLILGGTTNSSFDASKIGPAAQYRGFGAFQKTGSSTWFLSGTTAAVTPWAISAGTLAVGQDANLGAVSGGLTLDGGTLEATSGFNSARTITLGAGGGTIQTDSSGTPLALAGTISGPGRLTTTGDGTLILSGVNTYAGGTLVSHGDVEVDTTGALGTGPVVVDGTNSPLLPPILTFNPGTSAQSLSIQNQNAGQTGFAGNATAGSATITNTAGGLTAFYDTSSAGQARIINQGTAATLFAHQASAGQAAITNNAGGRLVFLDASTADGATVINNAGGTVDLSGLAPLAPATVPTLGIGSLSGAGNVNLGSAVLTLGGLNGNDTVSGVIADGGMNGGTGASLVKVGTGTLILNGVNTYTGGTTVNAGTLEVGDASTPTARIAGNVQVNAAGTLRGHGTVGGSVINDGTVRPGGSIGTLTIAGDYTQGPGGTLMVDVSPTAASQLKVVGTATLGGTLSVLYGPGTYTTASYQLISAGAVKGAFATVTGNMPSGLAQSVTVGATGVNLNAVGAGSVVVAPTNATLFGAMGSAALRAGQQVNDDLLNRLSRPCLSPGEQACVQPNRGVWIQANGTDTRIDGNHGAPDVHDKRYGFLAGVDRVLDNGWTVGVAGGYSHTDVTESGTGATGKLDTLRLAGYAGKSLGRVNVAGTVGYAYDTLSTTRPFGSLGRAEGSGHGQEFNAGVQASLPWAVGPVAVTPRLGVRYAHVDGLGLNETGPTSQNLGVASQSLDSLQLYLGMTLDYPLNPASERPASLQARLGYAYETQSTGRNVSVTAADGTGFVIPGTSDSRGLLTAGLGATLPMGKATKAYVRYDALLHTGNVSAQSLQAGVSYQF